MTEQPELLSVEREPHDELLFEYEAKFANLIKMRALQEQIISTTTQLVAYVHVASGLGLSDVLLGLAITHASTAKTIERLSALIADGKAEVDALRGKLVQLLD